jgi:hypothetical protein
MGTILLVILVGLDMFPGLSVNQAPQSFVIHFKLPCQSEHGNAASRVPFPNSNDLLFTELRRVNFGAFDLSSFSSLVGHIVAMAAKKKMAGADTEGVITVMKHQDSSSDRAVFQLIRETMRPNRFLVCPELPVAIFVRASLPKPAFFGLENKRPKTCHGLSGFEVETALRSAKNSNFGAVRFHQKHFATLPAIQGDSTLMSRHDRSCVSDCV